MIVLRILLVLAGAGVVVLTIGSALRTVVLKDGKAHVQAGAGVVADSTPEGEYVETVNKAMGMMAAIARAKEAPAL